MRLEVTGIVNLEQAIDVPWRFSIERMWLQLRYLGDIKNNFRSSLDEHNTPLLHCSNHDWYHFYIVVYCRCIKKNSLSTNRINWFSN